LGSHRVTARAGIILGVTLSEAAQLQVGLNRLVAGRKLGRHCRAGVRRGKRCTLSRRVRRLSLHAKPGRTRHHLSLRRLAPGRYTAAITATGTGGVRSRTVTVHFRIVRARR
jgi:hypothetical protein